MGTVVVVATSGASVVVDTVTPVVLVASCINCDFDAPPLPECPHPASATLTTVIASAARIPPVPAMIPSLLLRETHRGARKGLVRA
jgi:hypothetical protein